jgi:L-seryl-tRNA(Ser) seleniumtransferase
LQPDKALKSIPTLRMLIEPEESLHQRARQLTEQVMAALNQYADVTWEKGYSRVGGGAMPTTDMPTGLCVIRPKQISISTLVERLRAGTTPVVGRVHDDALLLDVRTIQPHDTDPLLAALIETLQPESGDV